MSALLNAVQAFIDDIQGERGWVEELNQHSRNVAQHFAGASLNEINEALQRFAALFPELPLVALGQVAITCGSLVERGGDPAITGPAVLEKLPRVNETAADFYERCRVLATADATLMKELHEATEAGANGARETGEPAPMELIDDHVASEGWQRLAGRFGPVLFQEHPTSVLGYMAEAFFRLALIAHLSRSKALRRAARSRPELLDGTLRCDDLSRSHRSFLATMLRVLDDELLLVLHVAQRKGFDVRISGISDNFQLHVLLAGAIIGSPAEGFVAGEAPSRRAVAECRDATCDEQGGQPVTGAFNLCNWTALRPDGSLPGGQGQDASRHWIWNEGCPAEIVPFERRRVVLLGAPPYSRHWRACRQFQGMTGELTVERVLDAAMVEDWLNRLARAARG
jgi:hypothetical protein